MILKNFALIASDTTRTKSYLQAMISENLLPEICIVYSENINEMRNRGEVYKKENKIYEFFDMNEPIHFSLEQASIPYIEVESKDINSKEMIQAINSIDSKYIIYSGYGGYILKSDLFQLGKEYIHIHAGILPQYRGSTTVYYSYLEEKTMGATAIFLNEKIDEGEIILQETFDIFNEKEIPNIDYIYEPYIRSCVLIKVLKMYIENDMLQSNKQIEKGANTYYIIHPLLKHIALLGIESNIARRTK